MNHESRKKISIAMKKLIASGIFFTKEHRKKISESLKGRKITWNTTHHCVSHRKGISMEKEYGIKKANEIKNKISLKTKIALKNPEIHKKIVESASKGLRTLALKQRTYIEEKMKKILDNLHIFYEEQKIIKMKTNNGGNWRMVDFYLPKSNLVIECDGEHWHTKEGNDIKNKELNEKGFDVIRYSGTKIIKFPQDISNHIEIWNNRMVRFNEQNKFTV
jgi:very-short-patch-repair endonuclease